MATIITETLLIHYKITSQEERLKLRINDLNSQQERRSRKLLKFQQFGFNVEKSCIQMMKSFERKFNIRVQRDIKEKYQPPLEYLTVLGVQLLRLTHEERRLKTLMSQDLVKHEACRNVTLVCKKGQRGPRGKSGPRVHKERWGQERERFFWFTEMGWSARCNGAERAKGGSRTIG